MSFTTDVYEAVKRIPRGRVTTYGQIARIIGKPRACRAVGNALHVNPHPGEVTPCHRVVKRNGELACKFGFGGIDNQKNLLQQEGVFVDALYIVDLNVYGCSDEEISQTTAAFAALP